MDKSDPYYDDGWRACGKCQAGFTTWEPEIMMNKIVVGMKSPMIICARSAGERLQWRRRENTLRLRPLQAKHVRTRPAGVALCRLDVTSPSTGWRLWVYIRKYFACCFDVYFDRRTNRESKF